MVELTVLTKPPCLKSRQINGLAPTDQMEIGTLQKRWSRSKIRNPAPCRGAEAFRPVGAWIHNRWFARNQVRDEVASPWSNAEAMTAAAGGQNEARNTLNFADGRNAIGCAVDISGPYVGYGHLPHARHEIASSRVGETD